MRAGDYASYQGREYSAYSPRGGRTVRLTLPAEHDAVPGFTRDTMGVWERQVSIDELDRLFRVVTEATWEGHEVSVRKIEGDKVSLWSRMYPPPNRPEVRHDRDSWRAVVPAAELRDVVSTVHDVVPTAL